jgi:hypothetical protein
MEPYSSMTNFRQPASKATRRSATGAILLPLLLLGALAACDRIPLPDREEHPAPSVTDLEGYYSFPSGDLLLGMSGNVAQVTVTVDPEPYRRGGDLWAKSLPYIFLFSQGTQDAFEQHPGLGGIRVRVLHPTGDVMAEARLARDAMSDRDWREALSIAGQARRDGTERPGTMGRLVRWGEDHTQFEYNPDYITPQ